MHPEMNTFRAAIYWLLDFLRSHCPVFDCGPCPQDPWAATPLYSTLSVHVVNEHGNQLLLIPQGSHLQMYFPPLSVTLQAKELDPACNTSEQRMKKINWIDGEWW